MPDKRNYKKYSFTKKKKGKHGRGPSSASTLFAFVRFYVNQL